MIKYNNAPGVDFNIRESLRKIRESYGNTTQILVSNEELCELATVCAKFPRYTDPEKARTELRSKAIDEVADVLIIMDHVINIFGLSDEDIEKRIIGKVDRIDRWLKKGNGQEQTTIDREVINSCSGCKHVGNFQQLKMGGRCFRCAQSGFSLKEPKEDATE